MNQREEITASVAAHAELGPRYDAAVAEGLVERIGDEIDRRIDARLGSAQPPRPRAAAAAPAAGAEHRRSIGITGMILGLGSMGIAAGATSIVASHHANSAAQIVMILLIWTAITIINVAHARRR